MILNQSILFAGAESYVPPPMKYIFGVTSLTTLVASQDLITYIPSVITPSISSAVVNSINYSNGLYYAVGRLKTSANDDCYLISKDGINWKSILIPENPDPLKAFTYGALNSVFNLRGITYITANAYTFFGGQYQNYILKTIDGYSSKWIPITGNLTYGYSYANVIDNIAYITKLGGPTGSDSQIKTDDCKSFINYMPTPNINTVKFNVINPGLYGARNLGLSNPLNGITKLNTTTNQWETIYTDNTLQGGDRLKNIMTSPSRMIAWANRYYYTSVDGINWFRVNNPDSTPLSQIQDIVWDGSKFILINLNRNTYYTSTDGLTWTSNTLSTYNTRSAIYASN